MERVGGLQTQYSPSAYIGAWSRLNGFERRPMTEAFERSRLIQATLMRVTIHMVASGLLADRSRRARTASGLVARGDTPHRRCSNDVGDPAQGCAPCSPTARCAGRRS
ncbi:MAG: DNA glycosylase AlkZ-like family protein [Actinomycetota bacterium]